MAGAVRFDKDQSGPSLGDAATTIASLLMIGFPWFALARVFGISCIASVALKQQHLIGFATRTFHAG